MQQGFLPLGSGDTGDTLQGASDMEDEPGLLMGTETSKQAEALSWEKSVTWGTRNVCLSHGHT